MNGWLAATLVWGFAGAAWIVALYYLKIRTINIGRIKRRRK